MALDLSEWADTTPIPQLDGENPIAAIAYTQEYSEAMGYLRAAMARDEYSDRALALTARVIDMNPAHYTVWAYRAQTLFYLGKDLAAELLWISDVAEENAKNFQIWHHREVVLDKHGTADGELAFLNRMLESDAKNYHVWTYRQWVMRRFDLPIPQELQFADSLIVRDVLNNSAWSYRWFLAFGIVEADASIAQREAEYAVDKIRLAPANPSPWNYLRWIVERYPGSGMLATARSSVHEFALDAEQPAPAALEWLADLEHEGNRERALHALDTLVAIDPMRKGYYEMKKADLKVA